MSDRLVVDLFVEDRAHEEFLKPLVTRIAGEDGIDVWARVRSGTGGHARALAEFKLYQRVVALSPATSVAADLVVVAIDGNCSTFADARKRLHDAAVPSLQDRIVVACPDPHVERWYVADPQSFETVAGSRPDVGSRKCARDHYKRILANAIAQGGHPVILGGVEFAAELVAVMDIYRAGRNDSSLKAFVDDFRAGLRRAPRRTQET